jgi:hypothetical protein
MVYCPLCIRPPVPDTGSHGMVGRCPCRLLRVYTDPAVYLGPMPGMDHMVLAWTHGRGPHTASACLSELEVLDILNSLTASIVLGS